MYNPSTCLWTRKQLSPNLAVKDTLPHIIKHRLVLFLSFSFCSRLVGFMNRLVHLLEDTLLQNVLVIHSHAKTLEFICCRAGRCRLDTLSVDLQQGSRPLCAFVTDKEINLKVKLMTWTMLLLFFFFYKMLNVLLLTTGPLIRSIIDREQCCSLRALTASGQRAIGRAPCGSILLTPTRCKGSAGRAGEPGGLLVLWTLCRHELRYHFLIKKITAGETQH